MNKILITSVMLLISSATFSEASIDMHDQQKTFLLTAPGTVTGTNQLPSGQTDSNRAVTTLPQNNPVNRQRPMRYKYVGESTKFRQFGQEPGQNNPWFQNFNSQYPGRSADMRQAPLTNPWQLGGMPSMRGMMNNSSAPPYSADSYSPYQPGNNSSNDRLYPDFPVGIYRDTNPAAFSMPSHNKNYMPGFSGDNFGFPFSPFGMFK
ncbi:MAG: hypothetical protein GY744_07215 [Gammaproteobacteria bacterium]|nr:hypothetical protein [Gammaproteobacteria bacterium]